MHTVLFLFHLEKNIGFQVLNTRQHINHIIADNTIHGLVPPLLGLLLDFLLYGVTDEQLNEIYNIFDFDSSLITNS